MLPLRVSLRRLAGRSTARLQHRISSLGLPAVGNAERTLTIGVQSPIGAIHPANWFSTATAHTEGDVAADADDSIILEPLPIQTGFVGQKPLLDFDLSSTTLRNLDKVGITHLFPVQAQSFAVMMNGSDIVGRSKTGSGKTLAFALPIVEKIVANKNSSRDPQALVLLPTRELALQVSEEIKRISPQLRTATLVGGVSYTIQENQLRRGVDILVGTPGRIMDMVDKGNLSLDEVEVSVLDEADMMLKFGFQEAVETILGWIPGDRQCVMWSATFPKWVNSMARKFLKSPVSIDLVGTDDNHVPTTVTHKAIHAPAHTRIGLLDSVLNRHANGGQTLVFTETKQEADQIANALTGHHVRALHGDLSQGMRTSTMAGFRDGSVRTLVCTDIAARGLDIANVELVVQFRLPSDKESFVHRAGRTGRAGRSGTNIVFFDRTDANDVLDFESRYKFKFNHTAPPHPELMLEAAVSDVTKKLTKMPRDSTRMFEETAQRMLDEQGVTVLSSALALLCGFDSKKLHSISMITGKHKMQTVEVEGLKSARELNQILSSFSNDGSRYDIYPVDGKLVFDIPYNTLGQLREHLGKSDINDVTISPVMELPRVLIDKSSSGNRNNSNWRGQSANRFDRNGTQSGNNRWRSGGRDNRSSSRNFDSSFSKGRDSNNRFARKNSSNFGRFSEGRSSSRSDKWSKSW